MHYQLFLKESITDKIKLHPWLESSLIFYSKMLISGWRKFTSPFLRVFDNKAQAVSLTEKREIGFCNDITLICQKSRNVPAPRFRRPWKVPRGRALFYIQGMLFHRCFSNSSIPATFDWSPKRKSFLLGSIQKKGFGTYPIPQWSVRWVAQL